MAVSRGGWLHGKGNTKRGKSFLGVLVGLVSLALVMGVFVPMASAEISDIAIQIPHSETYWSAASHDIVWLQTNTETTDSVDIFYSEAGADNWQAIATNYTTGVSGTGAVASYTWNTSGVPSGQYQIKIEAYGNPSVRDISEIFTIDSDPPYIDEAYFTGDTQLYVHFSEAVNLNYPASFALPGAATSVSADSAAASITSAYLNVAGLTATAQCAGATLYVSGPAVVDLAGNPISPATAWVTGDTTPPQVTVTITPNPASAVTISFVFDFSETMSSATPVVTFRKSCDPTKTVQVLGDWVDSDTWAGSARSVHVINDAEEGLNDLIISQINPVYDRCGNPLSGVVTQFILDKTAPTITKVSGPDAGVCVTDSTPLFTVDVADTMPPCTDQYAGVVAIEYLASPATSSWQTVPVNPPSITTSITFTTFALSPDTTYSVWVRSVDAASNRSSTVLYTFNLDTTPPTITSAEFITDDKMVINFSEPVDVVHPESFALPITHAAGLEWPPLLTNITNVTVTVSGLTVQCTGSTLSLSPGAVVDLCGNPIQQVTATVASDTTAPLFVSAEFTSCASMDVTFNEALSDATIDPASFWSAYCTFTSATLDPNNNRLVHLGVSGLSATEQTNGINDLWIKAGAVLDVCGNPIASVSPLTVAGDTTPPQVVSVSASPNLVSAATVSLTVTFNECMDTSVDPTVTFGVATPYTAYAVATGSWVSATQWTGSVKAPCDSEGINGVRVADARDVAGNTISPTEFDNVFTIDCTGPDAAVISIDGVSCGGYINTATPTITVQASDTVCSVDTIQYRVEPSLSWTTVTPSPTPATVVTASFKLADPLSPDGTYCIWVRARDVLGNMGPERQCCFTVDTTPPEFVGAEFISCDQMKVYFDEPVTDDINAAINAASFSSTAVSFTTGFVWTADPSVVYLNLSVATVSVTEQTNGITGPAGLNILQGAVFDYAGNPIQTITGQAVDGDTWQPYVSTMSASHCCVDAITQGVTLEFSECMATWDTISVTVGTQSPYASYPVVGGWVDTNTWHGEISATSVATLPEGWYGIAVSGARDRAGNLIDPNPTTQSNKFVVDHTRPTVDIRVTPRPVFAGEEIHVSMHFSEPVGEYYTNWKVKIYNQNYEVVKIVNGDWVSPVTYVCTYPMYDEWAGITTAPLSAGTYRVQIYNPGYLRDCPGMEGEYNHWVYPYWSDWFEVMPRDDTPPVIDNMSPTGIISDATPTISASFSDTGSGISTGSARMVVDGVDVTASANVTTSGITYTPASALSEGVHVVTVDVADIAGNWANQASWQFVVDTQGAESIYIVSPLANSYIKGDMNVEAVVSDVWSGANQVSFFATDASVAVGGVSLGVATAQPWAITCDTTALSDGTWYLYAVVNDAVGNAATSSTVKVTIDNTAPVISISGTWPIWAKAGDSEFVEFTYTEDNPSSVVLELISGTTVYSRAEITTGLAGGTNVSAGILGVLPSDLPEGVYDLKVTMTDAAGSSASDTIAGAVQVDNTAPAFTWMYPTPFDTVNFSDVPVEADYQDDGSGIDLSAVTMIFDGMDVTSEASITSTAIIYQATDLAEGQHYVEVNIADEAGNTAQTTWVFTVDTTAPTVVINKPNDGDFVSGTITIEAGVGAEDVTNVDFYYVGSQEVAIGSDYDGSDGWSISWNTTTVDDGTVGIYAIAMDEAGNTASSELVQVTIDNTSPVVEVVDPVSSNVAYVQPGDNLKITYTYQEAYPYAIDIEIKNADGEVAGSAHVENLLGVTSPITVTTTVPIFSEPDVGVGTYDVIVTITDYAGHTATYTAEDAVCVFLPKIQKVVGSAGGTVELGDGTKVEIPAGAVDTDTLITIEALEPQDIPELDLAGVTPTDVARFFGPEGFVFARLVTVTIPYTERDIAGLDESKLALYVWDGGGWYRVGDEVVDSTNNTISAKVNHFSIYRIVEDTTEVSGFKVYLTRNPFRSGEGTIFVYSLPKAGKVTLKIYDAAGDLVRTLLDGETQSAGWHNVKWDGDNDFFSFVGSGIYLYRFEVEYTAGGSDKVIKTVGVIK